MSPLRQVVLGVFLGIVLGVVGIELGPWGAIAVVALVIALGRVMRLPFLLAAGLATIGGIWLALVLNSQLICARTDDFCGNANFAPWLFVSVLVLLAGAVAGLLAARPCRP